MSFLFTCPHCGLETTVDDALAGEAGQCARCGKPVVMPTPDQIAAFRPADQDGNRWSALMVGLGVVVTLAAVVAVAVVWTPALVNRLWMASSSARTCADNLRLLALGLRNYELQHGCFPPSYLPDAQGRPMHSWRVLILPHIGRDDLYQQYDFDEPWDSAGNLLLLSKVPDALQCPADPSGSLAGRTSYFMVVGSGLMTDGTSTLRPEEVRDGLGQTIILVESSDCDTAWLEPEDLVYDDMSLQVNEFGTDSIRARHRSIAHVVTCDGTVLAVGGDTSSDYLRALLTPNGGEPVTVTPAPGN